MISYTQHGRYIHLLLKMIRGLRDIVVETLYKNPIWLDKEEVRDVLRELGTLTYDLVIHMGQRRNA